MRAQASFEYTLTAVVILSIVIPAAYLLYSSSHRYNEEVILAQANKIGQEIVKASESVYFMGAPSRIVLEENMPPNIVGMNVLFDEINNVYELIIRVQTGTTITELSFPSDVPINSFFDKKVFSEGKKNIRVEARTNPATGKMWSWIGTSNPCTIDDDCANDEICDQNFLECVSCAASVCGPCHSASPHCQQCAVDDSAGGCNAGEICSSGSCACTGTDADTDGYVSILCVSGNDCDDSKNYVNPGALEICDGIDNNCINGVDEGCDDDTDNYCDADIACSGTPSCSNGCSQLDCDDANALVPNPANPYCDCNPATGGGATQGAAEVCNDIDDDCDGLIDEGCDDDLDDYCDSAMTTVGTPAVCLNGGGDCNDDNAFVPAPGNVYCDCNPATGGGATQGAAEVCNDIDDDCDGLIDEGCDDDSDRYCDASMTVEGTPAVCPNGLNDCDDSSPTKWRLGYTDGDNDGYGTGLTEICVGNEPGYSGNNDDCYDSNANAKPGQTNYYTVNRGDGSFDYNCDNIKGKNPAYACTTTLITVNECKWPTRPTGHVGYDPDTGVPNCGESEIYWICRNYGSAPAGICNDPPDSTSEQCSQECEPGKVSWRKLATYRTMACR